MMKQAKSFVFGLLLALTFSVFAAAQEGAMSTYRYDLPLPEKTFSGNWEYIFAVSGVGEEEFFIRLMGIDSRGNTVKDDAYAVYGSGVFNWVSNGHLGAALIQSVVFLSEKPLVGVVAYHNLVTGQVNIFTLENVVSNQLVLPFIPENVFLFKTSFSVKAVPTLSNELATLYFGYTDPFGHFSGDQAIGTLRGDAYVRKTPNQDLPIGELGENVIASWGRLMVDSPTLGLTGYQTITGQLGVPESFNAERTAAVEFEDPRDQGYLRIGSYTRGERSLSFTELFSFTNPQSSLVFLELTAFYQTYDEEGDLITRRLPPKSFNIGAGLVLKRALFGTGGFFVQADFDGLLPIDEETGLPESPSIVGLAYRSTFPVDSSLPVEEQVAVPAPIYALHLKFENGGVGFGGRGFASSGEKVIAILPIVEGMDSYLTISNDGSGPVNLALDVFDKYGGVIPLFGEDSLFALPSGMDSITISSREIIDFLILDQGVDPLHFFRVEARVMPLSDTGDADQEIQTGSIFAGLYMHSAVDIALSNCSVFTLQDLPLPSGK